MLKRISDILVDKSKWFFLVITILLGAVFLNLKPVPINGELEGFYMERNPYAASFKEVADFFNYKHLIQLQLTPTECNLGEFMEGLKQLTDSLQYHFPKAKIISLHRSKYLIYNTYDKSELLSDILPGIKNISILDQLISDDKKHVLVLLQLENEDDFDLASFSKIIALEYNAVARIIAMSQFHIEQQIHDSLKSDLQRISILVLIDIILIILLIYKSVKALLPLAVNIIFSLIPLFLALNVFGVELNMITITSIPVVIILSLADTIHLLTAFYKSESLSKSECIKENIRKYILPSFYTSFTTSIAFFSFALNDSKYIQEFGIVSGIAVLLEFVITFMTLPHLLKFLQNSKPNKTIIASERIFSNFLRFKKHGSILLICILVASLFYISNLNFNTNYDSFFPRNTALKVNHQEIGSNFQSLFGIDILIKAKDKSRSSLKQITIEVVDKLEELKHIRIVTSYKDVVKLKQKYPLLNITNHFNDVENIYLREHTSRIHISLKNPSKVLNIKEEVDRITNTYQNDYEFSIFSAALLFDYINEHVAVSLLKSLLFSGIFIFLIFLFLTHSIRNSLISILANLVPLGVLILLFVLFRIDINIGTAITAVVCLGLIVDDTIQIIYRKLILKKPFSDLNFSLLITSVLLAVGYCIFAISNFEPVQTFGVLSAIVFVVTFFSDILILNYLLKDNGKEKQH